MATKRRKVWVNEYQGYLSSSMHKSLREARMGRGTVSRAKSVCFVERLPGDVVLSREEAAARKHAAERLEVWLKDMKMENLDECDHIRQSCGDVGCTRPVTDAIALLRGRR